MKKDLKKGPIKTKIFLTHTHWDHIMGFPFFTPIFIKNAKLEVYGPVSFEEDTLDKVVGDQLQYRYFPVNMEQLDADINYSRLKEAEMDLGDGLKLTTKYLNHPIMVLGYRFEYEGKVFCTAYDHEPYSNIFDVPADDPSYDANAVKEGALAAREENEKVEAFFADADLLVHDTQYTQKEYLKDKRGWGHSSFEWAINSANQRAREAPRPLPPRAHAQRPGAGEAVLQSRQPAQGEDAHEGLPGPGRREHRSLGPAAAHRARPPAR